MKLLIDSQALERLLGGDTELEVQLRTNIANQFADKFLKSLVNSQLITTTGKDIENIIRTEISSGSMWNKTLSPKYNQLLKDELYITMIDVIKVEIKNLLESGNYKTRIEEFIQEEANLIANEWTAENIESRIQAAADKKIKEKLGIK